MVTMEIIIEQTDRLCWRKRGRVRERGTQREKKTTGEEERNKTVGGKVAEMFVGIPQKNPVAAVCDETARAGMWWKLNPRSVSSNHLLAE